MYINTSLAAFLRRVAARIDPVGDRILFKGDAHTSFLAKAAAEYGKQISVPRRADAAQELKHLREIDGGHRVPFAQMYFLDGPEVAARLERGRAEQVARIRQAEAAKELSRLRKLDEDAKDA